MTNEEPTEEIIKEPVEEPVEEPIEEPVEEPVWIKMGYPTEAHMNWFSKDNDYDLLRSFDLNENSVIVDIGMYTGVWLKDMYCKYRCNCIGVEPILEYFSKAQNILTDSSKIFLFDYAITNFKGKIYSNINGDASRLTENDNKTIKIKKMKVQSFFNLIENVIDVLQINVEGSEYEILPIILKTNILDNVKNIQIQFHNINEESKYRMNDIINKIKNRGFEMKFNYEFVWCGFKNTKLL